MATRQVVYPAGMLQYGTAGNSYPKPSVVADTNDFFPRIIPALKDGGTGYLILDDVVPRDYVGSPKWYVRWRAPATTGVARFHIAVRTYAAGDSMDPSTAAETLTSVDATTAGTSLALSETSLGTGTAGNYVAGRQMHARLAREGGHANDTLTVDAEIEALVFEYSDA